MRYVFLLLFSSVSIHLSAQGFNPYKAYGEPAPQKSTFRTILNKITVTAASGFGHSFYSHDLNNYNIIINKDRLYINPENTSDYYYRWLNKPERADFTPNTDDIVRTDTASIGFKGTGFSIPLMLSLHYQYNRFRVGLGGSIEFHQFKRMEPDQYASTIGSYTESFSTMFTRFFGTLGVELYQWYDYHYFLDVKIGGMGYGSGFDKSLMQKKGMFINFGVPIERKFSEYFTVFVRPSYEFKNFTMGLPESDLAIKNKHQAFYINIGFRYNYPDLKRCPIKSCETQKRHLHQGREFRGRPFYKKQNPQIGENYKHSPIFKKGNDKDAPKSNVRKKDPRK